MRLKHRIWRTAKATQYWLIAQAAFAGMGLLHLLPARSATLFAGRMARRFGPLFGRHRVALANLQQAMPELTEDERKAIALDMWENMGRLAAEYIFLDDLVSYDPENPDAGTIEVHGEQRFVDLRAETDRPHIFFTAHMGNFELLPVSAAVFGLEVTALFRPPNNPYIARKLLGARRTAMGGLVPSKAGAAWALAGKLDANGNVGVLVDQHFSRGIETTFFGKPCLSNPLLGTLARHHDCDVYPARCIRLPDGRFRVDLYDKLDLPRDSDGRVDVLATTQLVGDVVESWIREHPGQWMWFHKRWKMLPMKYRRRVKRSEKQP